MPLALANDKTRIVLAGDHMQVSSQIWFPRDIEVSVKDIFPYWLNFLNFERGKNCFDGTHQEMNFWSF